MSVLTFKSDEYLTFPPLLREYASHMTMIQGKSVGKSNEKYTVLMTERHGTWIIHFTYGYTSD